ncbi:hypothetical protein KUTeg_013152 [Tegillarca granosa]|uniref:Uncharacterized protein n=1 Tax=Tegillarca granosa TaxID=220873 RepID=A0ABQ9EYC2_TEGGR|nr:hypothetical protein KUTeg_013152 [Tegillarca granosa]
MTDLTNFKMNEQAYFHHHWDLIRQPLQPPAFGMGSSLLDFRSRDVGVEFGEGMTTVGGGRILELRKEKSRDAARSRRGKENYEFYELAKLLPLPAAITSQLDKASIIRLSISYLKLREFSGHGDPPWNREQPPTKSVKGPGRRRNLATVAIDVYESHQGTHILQSLDGFAFILSTDGRFLYVSETVSIYLGLSQVEMTGSSVFDYVHHQDHQELADQLGLGFPLTSPTNVPSPDSQSEDGSAPPTPRSSTPPSPDRDKGFDRMFCLRMKSTLTKRGVHVRTSGYRVVQILGQLRPHVWSSLSKKQPSQILGMVCVAIALPPPSITELRIERDTFIMRLNPDFKVIYCDPYVSELTDWASDDINNRILYEICHAGDLNKLRQSHVDLLSKSQVLSSYYRLMNKSGGYVWVQMCATTLYNNKTTDDHTVLAIFYVLSGIKYGGCVMDTSQMKGAGLSELEPSDHTDLEEHSSDTMQDENDIRSGLETLGGENSGITNSTTRGTPQSQQDNVDVLIDPPNGDDVDDVPNIKKTKTEADDESSNAFHSDSFSQELQEVPVSAANNQKNQVIKSDFKYSRRKTDRPRKRKRGYSDESDEAIIDNTCLPEKSKNERLGSESLCDNNRNSVSLIGSHGNTNILSDTIRYSVSAPEDLSLNRGQSMTQKSPTSVHNCWQNSTKGDENGASSVKDLEHVMNKHLPNLSQHEEADLKSPTDLSMRHHSPSSNGIQKQRSTIQWVGTQDSSQLPASNLLRTLYANRESVIRSNTRQQCYNNDTNSVNMLTPPGSDGIKEQLTLNIPQISVNSKGSVLSSAYNNQMSVSDSYAMTPPSSVSPEDKMQSPFVDGSFESAPVSSCSLGNCASLENSISVHNTKSQSFSLCSQSSEYNTNSKLPYSSLPAYQMTDYSQYLQHNGNTNSVVVYDTRPEQWYPVSYTM